MTAKRRKDNSPAGRLMRQATAYARLAAKAHHEGNQAAHSRYQDRYLKLRSQAITIRERAQERSK